MSSFNFTPFNGAINNINKLKDKFEEFHAATLKRNICGRHNELLLRVMGLWPYQSPLARRVLFIIHEMFAMSVIVPCGISMAEAWKIDFNLGVGQLSGFCFFLSFPICFFIVYSRIPEFRVLIDEVSRTWQSLKDEFETDRVMKHSKLGHLICLVLTIYGTIFWAFCAVMLMAIPSMNLASPYVNDTGPFLVIQADYILFEQRDYYYLSALHLCGFTFAFLVSLTGVSSVFLVTIAHTRGFFSVTSSRYENLVLRQGTMNRHEESRLPYLELNDLKSAVALHAQTTKLCDLLEDALSPIALETQVFCVAQLALSYFCILEIDIPIEIKCGIVLVIIGIYFFLMVMGFVGQSITDSSEEVFESICMSNWYLAQPKDRKQFLIIMQRSQHPSVLTAGKFSNLSLESFVQLLKMSSSYFGAIASFKA